MARKQIKIQKVSNWMHRNARELEPEFIKSKDSQFYKENEDIVEQELDFLVDTLPENDIWPVSWSWFQAGKVYPKEEAISLRVSQARKGIEKMIFLKAFGRVH